MLENLPRIVFSLVIFSWFVFAAIFLLRKKPPQAPESRRDGLSLFGLTLQAVAFGTVWVFSRPHFTLFAPMGAMLQVVVALLTVALAFGSVWMILAAIHTLGRQYSLSARLVEGHRLVTEGPYNLVRNPIYAGMFGMMTATGVAVSHWWALAVAAAIFWLGTKLRVRCEEKLLREAFGEEFEAYAKRVPSLLPALFR